MKTGGTSINWALKDYGLGKYGVPKRTEEQKKLLNPIKHKRASELIEVEEFSNNWDEYFKFAFVRNPWDLLVSWYNYDKRGYRKFKKYILNKAWYEPKHLFKGCFDRISDNNGNIIVDFVGRFENIREDFQYVCKQIGIEADLPHKNKGKRGDYRKYYNSAMAEVVEQEFAKDIEVFGYKF